MVSFCDLSEDSGPLSPRSAVAAARTALVTGLYDVVPELAAVSYRVYLGARHSNYGSVRREVSASQPVRRSDASETVSAAEEGRRLAVDRVRRRRSRQFTGPDLAQPGVPASEQVHSERLFSKCLFS